MNDARYLPHTTSRVVTGKVIKVSIEPLFFSSAKIRIVIAGIKKLITRGKVSKKERSSALSIKKKVDTNVIPVYKRKIAHTIYAIGLVK